MSLKLLLFNPSPYPRGGHVVTPWEPIYKKTGIPPERLVVRDGSKGKLPAQVDRVDPTDPSRDVLVFSLGDEIPPGDEHYQHPTHQVWVEQGEPPPAGETQLELYTDETGGRQLMFKLGNGRMEASFSLAPSPWLGVERDWYAGAVYSVQLEGREILDAFQAETWLGHDEEKRCMQIDRLELSRPAWDWEPTQKVDLFDQAYSVLPKSVSRGPVRVGLTVVSPSFPYQYHDPFTGKLRYFRCQFYRHVSLLRGANFLLEQLFVKATPAGGKAAPVELCFAARYFTYMELGWKRRIRQYANVPDWFAASSVFSPFQGYGFATDVHASPVLSPHPEYPGPEDGPRRKTFSWWTRPSRGAKCLHLFWRNSLTDTKRPERPESQAGHAWYEFIYKPLRAEIEGDRDAPSTDRP